MRAASVPSVAVVVGPAIQAVEPSITRHVIVPAYEFPEPSAGLIRDHSPAGSPTSNWAATVSRRGGRVPYTYDPATNAPDPGGDADTVVPTTKAKTGLAGEGEGRGGEGVGDSEGTSVGSTALADGGGVTSVSATDKEGNTQKADQQGGREAEHEAPVDAPPACSPLEHARPDPRRDRCGRPTRTRNPTSSLRMPVAIERHDGQSARCAARSASSFGESGSLSCLAARRTKAS